MIAAVLALACGGSLLVGSGARSANPSEKLLPFAIRSWRSTPKMRIEDAYKWLFHATLGGEHAVQDDSGPRAWLDSEWATLGVPRKNEPLIQKLTPDGKLVRVNLRPYKKKGGDKDMLLALFVISARRFHADKSEFLSSWNELGEILRKKSLGQVKLKDWNRLERRLKPLGYPAIEHSKPYLKAYDPAYRVILGSQWLPPNRKR